MEGHPVKFCAACSAPLTLRTPEGDNRKRQVCTRCDFIHYQNPRIIGGALVIHEEKVLLCRRAIEPRKGYWTLPAGFLECGETLEEGASRETLEESLAEISIDGLYAVFSLPHINQVYMLFRAALLHGRFGAGSETLESRLFSEDDIPWDEMAFPTMTRTLKFYFKDRKTGKFPVHTDEIKGFQIRPQTS